MVTLAARSSSMSMAENEFMSISIHSI